MDRDALSHAARIRDALQRACVPFFESERPVRARLNVVVFSVLSPSILRFIQDQASEAGNSCVLAITIRSAPQLEEHAWRLLEAGATDTFAWEHSRHPELDLKARLARWLAIDELLQSPAVQTDLIGQSGAWIRCLRQIVEIAAFTPASILITGESGTGKELVARLIHRLDQRSKPGRELVVLDCTTVVPELSGSEFFGHERGAFTGASSAREGVLATADGGCLFLDEVGELPLRLQAELLRAVQERTYKRVGGNTWQKSEYRLICATHRDLVHEESQGNFRRDFYFRIASWICRLPSLQERREDIPALAKHFMAALRPDWEPQIDEPVKNFLERRSYPGNVRDLKQLVARIVHRHVGAGPITVGDLPPEERAPSAAVATSSGEDLFADCVSQALAIGVGLKDIGRMAEETAVRLAVQRAGGNLQLAAHQLRVSDRALQLRRAQSASRDS